ncbi:MAG: hypothetical protein ACI9FR_001930 [Cryomorphaceae bacterium]|jgi:hypothetical protein
MGMKIDIARLEPSQLNSECVTLLAMFARELELVHGVVLQLKGRDLLRCVVHHAHNKPDLKLETIYARLKSALRNHINSSEFDLSQYQSNLLASNSKSSRQNSAPIISQDQRRVS